MVLNLSEPQMICFIVMAAVRKNRLNAYLCLISCGAVVLLLHYYGLFSSLSYKREPMVKITDELWRNLTSRKGYGIYVRTFHKKKYFYDKLLVQSLKYFWPSRNVPLTVVLDAESRDDHSFGEDIATRYPYPKVLYEEPVLSNIYRNVGHFRQQRNMFYAERFTDYRYVGFIDTDTLFITTVTDDLMFENGKPVVIGQYGKASDFFWSGVGRGTNIMFKEPEVMRCMSYFPVFIKVEHLVLLRQYVEKLHNEPFDEVFKKAAAGYFSQFNMMCQYIWNQHRDEYSFHFQLRVTDGIWHGEGNSPFRQPYEYYQKFIRPEVTIPMPRTAVHYRYHKFFQNQTTYRRVLLEGLCFSGGFELCKEKCADYKETELQKPLFMFEASEWFWDERCLSEQNKHYKIVKQTITEEHKNRIKQGCAEVEQLTFNYTAG